jgi:serine/threonine-protein phosphatase 2B catalytic subunit
MPENSYLFLGDYVDRGCFGIEVSLCRACIFKHRPLISMISACYTCIPSRSGIHPRSSSFGEITNVVTSRSISHSNANVSHTSSYTQFPVPFDGLMVFSFFLLGLHKYSPQVYDACINSFYSLPITALVDSRFFCVHGGISPQLGHLDDLRHVRGVYQSCYSVTEPLMYPKVDRFREPGSDGLLCDLLWSDPIVNFGHEQEPGAHGQRLPPGTTFIENQTRGCSYFFTSVVFYSFYFLF